MSSVVSESIDLYGEVEISVQEEQDCKPLNLCTQQPTNNTEVDDGDPVRVKRSLKELIQARRIAEGKDILTVDFNHREVEDRELTPDEILRQKDRKEQNRKAAQRCRSKKKHFMQILQEEEDDLREKKRHLVAECEKLQQERESLLAFLRSNNVGGYIPPDKTNMAVDDCAKLHSADPVTTGRPAVDVHSADPVTTGKPAVDVKQEHSNVNVDKSGNASGESSVGKQVKKDARPKIVNKHPKQYYKERFQQDMSAENSCEESSDNTRPTTYSGGSKWNYKNNHQSQQESTEEGSRSVTAASEAENNGAAGGKPIENKPKQSEPLDFSKKDFCWSNINTSTASKGVQKLGANITDSNQDNSHLLPLTISYTESESESSQIDSSQQSCTTDVSDTDQFDSSQEAPNQHAYYRQQRAHIPQEVSNSFDDDDSYTDSDDDVMLIDLSQSGEGTTAY